MTNVICETNAHFANLIPLKKNDGVNQKSLLSKIQDGN